MNILYVGHDIEKVQTGADSVNKRNISLLKKIFFDCFYLYEPERKTNTIFEKIFGYLGGVSVQDEREILNFIKQNNINYVFISQSVYGRISRSIKKKYNNVKIIVFFHNIEKHYAKEYLKVSGIKHYPFYLSASFNEKLAVEYSDYRIVLNKRDSKLLFDTYSVKSNISLPVSYKDNFYYNNIKNVINDPPVYLFVGTAFFANIEGINNFIENVLPFVYGELIIVGKGMDKYKEKWESFERVKVFGFVDDLASFYYSSSVVLAPIFSGGGMKTKVAEALMYGKTIVGTSEAFEGYQIIDTAMYRCNTNSEFISCLNNLYSKNLLNSFNIESRNLFSLYYDDIVIERSINEFFSDIIKMDKK